MTVPSRPKGSYQPLGFCCSLVGLMNYHWGSALAALAERLQVDLEGLFLKLSTREPELPTYLAQAWDVRTGRGLAKGVIHPNALLRRRQLGPRESV